MYIVIIVLQAFTIACLLLLNIRQSRNLAALLDGRTLKQSLEAMANENNAAAERILERHRAAIDARANESELEKERR